jgi:hypothetical protein
MYINVHAIVLRAEKTSETDKRLVLYTREKGRLFASVKGIGLPKSRLAPAAEPAVLARFRLWTESDKPFVRVTGGAVETAVPFLRKDWARQMTAFFLCEWMEMLTPLGLPHPEKFDLLKKALSGLEKFDDVFVRLAYVTQFLEIAGYSIGPDVLGNFYTAQNRPLIKDLIAYDFVSSPVEGPFLPAIPALEEKIIRFVAPLTARPFKTVAHRYAMDRFREQQSTRQSVGV